MGKIFVHVRPRKSLWARISFWFERQKALFKYRAEKRRLERRIVPTRWLTPGDLIAEDLKYYEAPAGYEINQQFIADMAKARDEHLTTIRKHWIVTGACYIFIAANYFGIDLSLSAGGVAFADKPGVIEGLLLAINLLAVYTVIQFTHVYVLDSTIKGAIRKTVPEELWWIYQARYFPHQPYGIYFAFNLAHLIRNAFTRQFTSVMGYWFVGLFCVTASLYSASNLFFLIHYFILNQRIASWICYAILALIVSWGVWTFIYMACVRFRLPYKDYLNIHELEVLQQLNPRKHHERGAELFGPKHQLDDDMIARGYMAPQKTPETSTGTKQ